MAKIHSNSDILCFWVEAWLGHFWNPWPCLEQPTFVDRVYYIPLHVVLSTWHVFCSLISPSDQPQDPHLVIGRTWTHSWRPITGTLNYNKQHWILERHQIIESSIITVCVCVCACIRSSLSTLLFLFLNIWIYRYPIQKALKQLCPIEIQREPRRKSKFLGASLRGGKRNR